MSGSEEEYDDFEEQFRLERLEKERRNRCSNIEHGATRTDPDGTVYEWDADKLAYFPKIDQNFIAQYQMNYGTDPVVEEKKEENKVGPSKPSGDGTTDWSTYFSYVMNYSTEHGKYPPEMTKEHIEYYNYLYNYYYGNTASEEAKQVGETKTDKTKEGVEMKDGESVTKEKDGSTENTKEDAENDVDKDDESKTIEGGKDEGGKDEDGTNQSESLEKAETAEEKAYREYYEYYQNYYTKYPDGEADASVDSEQQEFDEWAYYNYYYGSEEGEGAEEKGNGEGKEEEEGGSDEDDEEEDKAKTRKRKREEKKPDGWFEMDATKNTNVYVSGLPEDITDDEFKELMNKCGMITLDPRGRDYKLKLYRDKDGKPKGDGLCCYMKSESVDLAVQMLNEYDVRGYRISVEVAQFKMKGKFDAKKRKNLSNKERKNIRKQQQKLLDWRPDKPIGYRPKYERIIVVKNAFNYKDFEEDPKRIQILREELRAQCVNFGTVKKVIVYDRHQEGLVSVAFDEVPEADLAIESLNGRFFNKRQITAEAWDGKTKYEVKESEAEREARLKQWETFLETDDDEKKKEAGKKGRGGKAGKGKSWKVEGGQGKQKTAPEAKSGANAAPGVSSVDVKRTDDDIVCAPSGGGDEKVSDPKESSATVSDQKPNTTDEPDPAQTLASSNAAPEAKIGADTAPGVSSAVVKGIDDDMVCTPSGGGDEKASDPKESPATVSDQEPKTTDKPDPAQTLSSSIASPAAPKGESVVDKERVVGDEAETMETGSATTETSSSSGTVDAETAMET